jgi:hypothetical protein
MAVLIRFKVYAQQQVCTPQYFRGRGLLGRERNGVGFMMEIAFLGRGWVKKLDREIEIEEIKYFF